MTETTEIIVQEEIFTVQDLREKEKSRLSIIAHSATHFDIEITSKEELARVHDKRMELQKCRTSVDKARKAFTEPLEKQKKEAIAVADELIAITEPIEKKLSQREADYEAKVKAEKEKNEAEEKRILQERVDELNKYQAVYEVEIIRKMSDEGFRMLADTFKKKYEEAQDIIRKEKEAADLKKKQEQEALDKQKEALDKQAEDLRKQQKEIDDKKKKEQDELEKKQKEDLDKKNAEDMRIKNEKTQNFLKENGYTEELANIFIVRNEGTKVVLYKKVGEIEL